ncbi:hypothetical protein DL93DRAFT_2095056 [Clavulina sp. PMI_390]|nr:hypothetical protein DL93DRAFT_2095056 [Clavulina sp. PMI_390]
MGSTQSNSLFSSSGAMLTGVVLVAGAYYFVSQNATLPNAPQGVVEAGSGKQAAKNKRKRENVKKLKQDAALAGSNIASSVDTLVAEEPVATANKPKSKAPAKKSEKQPLPPPDATSPLASSTPPPTTAPSSKSKKGKAKSAASTPQSSTILSSPTSQLPPLSASGDETTTASSVVDDDGWTKVGRVTSEADFGAKVSSKLQDEGSKAGKKGKKAAKKAETPTAPAASSQTLEPAAEPEKLTLAEKLLPKPEPTVVDDMLEKPAPLSRVMRVVDPNEKPPTGFSWGDFEDVDSSRVEDEDDGWSSVPTRMKKKAPATASTFVSGAVTPTPSSSRPDEPTKKQRQNQARRDAEKAAKADAEKERLAKLAKHKRELENERMKAQFASKGKALSGGMKATVDENGSLYWE